MKIERIVIILSMVLTPAIAKAAERTISDPDMLTCPTDAPGYPSRDPNMDALPGFQNPPPGYGEVPFWWWTGDPLDRDRLLWQVEELHKKGISGMQVNYAHKDTPGWLTYPNEPEIFTDPWWAAWSEVADACSRRGMGIGLSGYTLDWPNGESLISRTIYGETEIQGREIGITGKQRVKAGQAVEVALPSDTVAVRAYLTDDGFSTVGNVDLSDNIQEGRLNWTPDRGQWEIWIYTAPRKQGTLNPIHPLAGKRVVEKFFQPFQDHAPNKSAAGLNYFFHDELKFGVGDRIWADDLPEQFRRRKGYDLFEAVPAMVQDVGPKTVKYRLDFMDVKMQLAQERYFIPIFNWHWSRGKIYGCDQGSRGRNPNEFGDYFSSVRWYTAPGHDTPGGHGDLIKGKVSSSIAHFYKRPRVWLEGYHSLGWGATPENLMFATSENYLYGCNLLNLHGLYYTTHGSFWEWAPPCYHFRMPYWEHMGTFLKYFERLSYLMSQGVHQCDIAVLYPVSPGQANLGGREATSAAFGAGSNLFNAGYDFVFIDFESLARADIRDRRLNVSDASYRVLVLPAMRAIRWSTLEKALAFYRAGGTVIAIDALPVASDRAGTDDPVLDAAVKEMFGASAAEVESGSQTSIQNNAAGGMGIALLPKVSQPEVIRRYDGGFEGRWAWAKEPVQNVYFKAVCSNLPDESRRYRVRFFCDNEGTLYVGDKQICTGVNYTTGWTGEVELKRGDVITIDGRDHDSPGRRLTAGMFLAVVADKKTILSTEDLRYALKQPSANWRTDPKLDGLSALDPTNVHPAHLGVAPNGPAGSLAEAVASVVQPTVRSDRPVRATHRKVGPRDVFLVLGAPRGSDCTFQATGLAELWDPWTGDRRPLHVVARDDRHTTIRMPLEQNEAQIVVFTPGAANPAVPETSLAEITNIEVNGDAVRVKGLASAEGEQTATVVLGDRTVTLRGDAPTAPATMTVEGGWKFELQPTMANRWGDFRLPVTDDNKVIGAEARIFRYAEETSTSPGWNAADFNDSNWSRVTYGFGLKFWKLGPLPASVDPTGVEMKLSKMKTVDPSVPFEIEGKQYRWSPYAFSWRQGVEGDPGHQGYHGLKENISDDFIRLGRPRGGLNETLYGAEEGGTRYYLWTTAVVDRSARAKIHHGGEISPGAVYIGGEKVDDLDAEVLLGVGGSPILLRYDLPGRGHFVLDALPQSQPVARTPLSMTWYDRPGLVPFDALPADTRPAALWYRFVAPPGLRRMTFVAHGMARVWGDDRPMNVVSQTAADGAIRYVFRSDEPITAKSNVAIRIEPAGGFYGGSAIPEPISLDVGPGTTALGDWSQGSALECYSGGAWYRKTVTLDEEQTSGRVMLDLGHVVATAEVRVNGQQAGILVAPPWKLDITGLVQSGENRIEILVYNTLANHYRTIPTRYRGNPQSGLMGPVRLQFERPVTLSR